MVLKMIIFTAIIVGTSGMAVNNTEPIITEETPTLIEEAITECTVTYNISQEAIDDILYHVNVSADPGVKCWLCCTMKRIGMMKNGKMNWELCKNIAKLGLTNESDKAKIDKIAELCQSEVPSDLTDECEFAYSMASCMITYWNELELPKRSMRQ